MRTDDGSGYNKWFGGLSVVILKGLAKESKFLRRSPASWYIVGSALHAIGFSIYELFFNIYLYKLEYSQAFIGFIIALTGLVSAGAALPLAIFGERVSYGKSLRISAIITPILTVTAALFPRRSTLLLIALPGGLLGAWTSIVSGPLLAATSERDSRNLLFSFHYSATLLAGLIGKLIAGHFATFLKATYGRDEITALRQTLVLAGLIQVVALPFFFRFPIGTRPTAPTLRESLAQARQDWQTIRLLIVPNVVIRLGAGLILPFFNLFFALKFKASEDVLGNLFSLALFTVAIGDLLSGFLAHRWGRFEIIVYSQLVSIPLFFIIGFVSIFWVSAVAFILRHMLMNMASPLLSVLLLEKMPGHRRLFASAVFFTVWNGGWAIASYASGIIQKSYGFGPLFVLTPAIYLIGILYLLRNRQVYGDTSCRAQTEAGTARRHHI
ncbi:MAG: MFS transporter [bacterium JZ-2024 1]